ncbi:MAG TPA: hypothetical protein PKC28_16465, partial [Bdellovibrionales bacterium]|nr:hypothetical protein [Bdellovibrionales bacterium]
MRAFIAILILLTGHQAMAAVGDIRCMVRDFEIQGSQTIEKGAVELKVTAKNAVALRMEADLGEKSYVLSGDLVTGDFLLSQVWGP